MGAIQRKPSPERTGCVVCIGVLKQKLHQRAEGQGDGNLLWQSEEHERRHTRAKLNRLMESGVDASAVHFNGVVPTRCWR